MTIENNGWSWTATASLSLALMAPLLTYLGMWGIIGIGHGPSRGAHALFHAGLVLGILAAVLGVLGIAVARRRGRWLGIPGIVVGLAACWVIASILLDDLIRGQYFPFLR